MVDPRPGTPLPPPFAVWPLPLFPLLAFVLLAMTIYRPDAGLFPLVPFPVPVLVPVFVPLRVDEGFVNPVPFFAVVVVFGDDWLSCSRLLVRPLGYPVSVPEGVPVPVPAPLRNSVMSVRVFVLVAMTFPPVPGEHSKS